MVKRAYVNPPNTGEIQRDVPKDQVKIAFANNLQRAMVEKGYNQSELARRAAEYMPVDSETGKKRNFGRDSVSVYIRGRSIPGTVHLEALCKALGKKSDELLPTRGIPRAQDRSVPLDLRGMEDGNVWLKVNQATDWDTALAIVNLLKGKDGETTEDK